MELFPHKDISALDSLFKAARKVAILSHVHPDGDALGSSTAIALYLGSIGKESACILPNTVSDTLSYIPSPSVRYFYADKQLKRAEEWIRESDLIVLADANAFSRTDVLEQAAKESQVHKVLLDHHLNPDRENFALVFSTPEISSASEVVFWVLRELGCRMEGEIGKALMTGMTTDTNNFANSVFPSTFAMASELIANGVDRDAILQQIYNSYRENRVRLIGYMQHKEMHILPEGASYMVLTKKLLREFGAEEGETEGLVNIPLAIKEVRLSVLLKEDDGLFRVSVRSKKGTSAQNLALQYFHGGGHENAAGGKLFIGSDITTAEDAPAYVERILKEFLG